MSLQRFIYSKVLILLSMWWAWTVLTDFFVIPAVFRTIDMFFQAGELGIAVFSKLNYLEVIVGSTLVALLAYQTSKNKKAFPMFVMAIFLWIIAMTYLTFLTPKMTVLTELWKNADLMGLTGSADIPDLQQTHQFYHRIYVGIDTVKLVILTVMIFFGVLKQEKWS